VTVFLQPFHPKRKESESSHKRKAVDSFIDHYFARTKKDSSGCETRMFTTVAPETMVPFECRSCGKKFKNSGALGTHNSFKHAVVPGQKQLAPTKTSGKSLPFWKTLSFMVKGICWIAVLNAAKTVFVPYVYKPMKVDRRKTNKGKEKRTLLSFCQKARFIELYHEMKDEDSTLSQEAFCNGVSGITQSQLSKYLQNKEAIFTAAAGEEKHLLRAANSNSGARFPQLETDLAEAIRGRRKEGRQCTANWIKYKAMFLFKQMYWNLNTMMTLSL